MRRPNLKIETENFSTAYADWLDYYLNTLKVGIVMAMTGTSALRSGVGKSYSSIRTGELLDPDYSDGTTAMEKIIFRPKDFSHAMSYMEDKGKPQQVCIVDEASLLVNARAWHSMLNRGIAAAVVTFRQLRALAIFITPSLGDVDKEVRMYLSHQGACSKVWIGGTVPQLNVLMHFYKIDWDEYRNIYYKKRLLMWVKSRDRLCRFSEFKVTYPKNKELIDEYEKKAAKYKQQVRQAVADIDKADRPLNEIINEILLDRHLIKNSTRGLVCYYDDVRAEYSLTVKNALAVARNINERLRQEKPIKKDIKGKVIQ